MQTLPMLTVAAAVLAMSAGCQSDATAPEAVPTAGPLVLTVAPSLATINGGKFLKLTAMVRQPDGALSVRSGVTWASADGRIATVGATGIVEGQKAGRVQIVAAWHDSRGSSVVTVLDPTAKKPAACIEALQAKNGSGVPRSAGCKR